MKILPDTFEKISEKCRKLKKILKVVKNLYGMFEKT